jgi:hypothetical protein
MTTPGRFTVALLALSLALLACAVLSPTAAPPPVEPTATAVLATQSGATATAAPSVEPSAVLTAAPSAEPSDAPSAEPSDAPPATVLLDLEIVATQAWTDRQGNARADVLFRNPYDFPVAPSRSFAVLRDAAGDIMRQANLYFLDGISGGVGFLLPGETVAADACFTCEAALLSEAWAAVEFTTNVEDATGQWNYFTKVEPGAVTIEFEGDSHIFWFTGSVTNNEDIALQRISVRVLVFDEAGLFIGAGEGSAWDVPAGATASVDSYGVGQTPAGPFTTEVTALGVNY